MDAQFQALRADIINQLIPIIQHQTTFLKSEVMGIQKKGQQALSLQIKEFRQNIEKELSIIKNQRKQLQAEMKKVQQNRTTKEKALNKEISNLWQSLDDERLHKEIELLKKKYKEQERTVERLSAQLEKAFENAMTMTKKLEDPETIVSANSAHFDQFIVKKGRVEMKRGGGWHQLFGNIPLDRKPVNEFSLVRTKSKNIFLGVADAKYINGQYKKMSYTDNSINYQ